VRVLIGSRRAEGKGVGRFLLGFADAEASRLGVPVLRVDCYGGGQGDLVRFYESAGFQRTETFKVRDWPGQILERRLVSN
jgi:GNAT superfamily N-acetyltransferase